MNIGSIIESMLFISGEPISFKKLSKYTSVEVAELETAAAELAKKYSNEGRGLRILIKDKELQMVTAGENSKYVEGYLKADIEGELSRAALEVLSVVAYRGPIPRSKIEEIRGVNSSFTLRHLLIRGLVERIDNPSDARAYLYRISFDFLKRLGVENAENLPRFGELRNKKILEERFVENAEAKETNSLVQKEISVMEVEQSGSDIENGSMEQEHADDAGAGQDAAFAETVAEDQNEVQSQAQDPAQSLAQDQTNINHQ